MLKIIFYTIKTVIMREGISDEGMATAEDYGDYLLRTNQVSEEKYAELLELAKQIIGAN